MENRLAHPESYLLRHPEARLVVLLKMHGLKNTEIARRTGFSSLRVAKIMRRPEVQEYVQRRERELAAESDQILKLALNEAAYGMHKAVRRLSQMVQSKNTDVALRALDKLMEITGMGKEAASQMQPASTNVNVLNLSDPDVRRQAHVLLETVKSQDGVHRALPAGDR